MLERTVEEALAEAYLDPENELLSKSILGTTSAQEISDEIHTLCSRYLGSPPRSGLYVGFSVGASLGLSLEDGRQVFVKVNQPSNAHSFSPATLESQRAISILQRALSDQGFPCPRVVHEPVVFNLGIATFDSFEDVGEQKDAHESAIRESIAATLSDLLRRTDVYKSTPHLKHGSLFASRTLYPTPHNSLFDFERTAGGAQWIDEIAAHAKQIMDETRGRTVLGHGDWSLKHFRFVNQDIVMVYDWDSLVLEDELNLVGVAAATFPTTWDIETKITPSPEESYSFIREYEYVRGEAFRPAEVRRIAAATTYCMAYISRCEHALDPRGDRLEGSFRQTLKQHAGHGQDGLYLALE